MKKTFTSGFLGLVISGLLLASCSQMASYENEDLTLEQASADKAGFRLNPFGTTNGNENAFVDYYQGACESECIDPNDPETFFVLNGRKNFNSSGQIFIDYSIYHDASEIYYTFTIGTNNSSEPSIATFNGELVDAPSYSVSYPLEEGWQGCDLVERTFTLTRGGGGGGTTVVEIPTSYNLIPICTGEEETCDEAFSYERDETDPNIITFKYTPSTTIENAEIQLTVPHIEAYEPMDGRTYTGFGEEEENVLRWNGKLTCGEEITFTIKFTPISCTAAGPGNGLVNLVSTFNVKGFGNKLTGKPLTAHCIPD
ncbi:hypothetical protein [Algoriphagus sp. CAU 1675]|uniref:hypothetical protein n=1 Tax=Algoriphagus sp. CAU 1675 TaxID=3032597 RepID=UPI0023DAA3B2|nr:hypothetical protein [Algoriphagus sp. CAU 1675]MDF2156669.1 hypothetical protein [Algoriphagus sp. CAU 1675]